MNIREERHWTRETMTRQRLQHRKAAWAHVKGCPGCRHRLLAEPLPEDFVPPAQRVVSLQDFLFGGQQEASCETPANLAQKNDDPKVH